MTFLPRISAFLVFTIGAFGQSSAAIKGIKVLSSGFDPKTHIVRIVFVNHSSADITAYGISVQKRYQNSQGAEWTGSAAWGRDFVRSGAHSQSEAGKKSALPALSNQPIRPGQSAEESSDLSGERDIVGADMGIDMVAYSDGTAEVENEVTFQRLLISRQADFLAAQKIAEIGASVLSNQSDPHPVATLIAGLRQAKAVVPKTSWQGPEAEGFARCWAQNLDTLIGELQPPGSGADIDTTIQARQASARNGPGERDYVGSLIEAQMRYARIFSGQTEIRKVSQ